MTESLFVYWDKRLVGTLSISQKREFIFQYSPDWVSDKNAIQLSKTLPLQKESFDHDVSRPFFINLLPESEIRKLIAKKYGISEQNDFGLLAAIGGDCAGAISLLPADAPPNLDGSYRLIEGDDLDKMIEQMPKRPLLAAHEGMRLSLAGAQNKLPIYIDGDHKMYLPEGFNASSHILKPQIDQLPETVENEAFCMMLAKSLGLPVPDVEVRKGKHKAYIIKRYDRYPDADGTLKRIHQEDFCQALGFYPDQKYESEGGPKFKDCFDLIVKVSQDPLRDKYFLLYWAIFNYLIGNADAHAKNLSLVAHKTGVRLAPFYDLMSTAVYSDLATKIAMKIGGQYQRDRVTARQWIKFAEDAGISSKLVINYCKEMSEQLPKIAKQLAESFIPENGGESIVHKICIEIAETGRRTLVYLAEEHVARAEKELKDEAEREKKAKLEVEVKKT